MNKPFHQINVLVTGGSRGIGAAIAERFAAAGMNIMIHYHQAHEAANETARSCMKYGSRVMTIAADLSSKEQILRMRDKLEKREMMPDILVNNAGISHVGLIQDVTEDQWDAVINVNLKGCFLCTQTFLPYMIHQKTGRIINISSIWGITGASCEAVYAAAKGGINAFTKSLAKELAPSGITVNAVAPGPVETAMLARLDDIEKKDLLEAIPAGRFATPDEIAALVYFLSLPESAYINGQIISPNGAWLT